MRKIKLLLALLLVTLCLASCSSWSSMSNQEAYDFGYSIGSAIRNLGK
ncbi:MAG: hypothetical protein J6J76_02895 [Paraprevotella sp.]|nr:hypothetical protein [Paraprevotella sp.]